MKTAHKMGCESRRGRECNCGADNTLLLALRRIHDEADYGLNCDYPNFQTSQQVLKLIRTMAREAIDREE